MVRACRQSERAIARALSLFRFYRLKQVDAQEQGFWQGKLLPSECASLVRKYEHVFLAIDMKSGASQSDALRGTARQWPGSLREAQVVEPSVLRDRRDCAATGMKMAARSRGWWRDRGWACIPLWAELHPMLADQLAWRRTCRAKPVGAREFLAALSGDARRRWPVDAGELERVAGPRVTPVQAQRWLAVRIGWSLADLHRALFTRLGRSSGEKLPHAPPLPPIPG